MQKFKSHKVVEAAKVFAIFAQDEDGVVRVLLDGGEEVNLPVRLLPQDDPSKAVGGYAVRYPDGYTSWSPAEAFEEGYDPVDDDAAQALPLATDAQLQAPAISPVRVEALRLALGLGLSDHERVVTAARAFEAYFEGSAEDLPQIAAQ